MGEKWGSGQQERENSSEGLETTGSSSILNTGLGDPDEAQCSFLREVGCRGLHSLWAGPIWRGIVDLVRVS